MEYIFERLILFLAPFFFRGGKRAVERINTAMAEGHDFEGAVEVATQQFNQDKAKEKEIPFLDEQKNGNGKNRIAKTLPAPEKPTFRSK